MHPYNNADKNSTSNNSPRFPGERRRELDIPPLGLGFRFRAQGSGFRVQGSGFRVQGSGFRV